ncbi:MAG: energy transducer TonB [bacterium]
MANQTFKLPTPRTELPVSILLGSGFALLLFVLMALAQMLGEVVVPKKDLVEQLVAYTPPEIEQLEEEPPPPPPEEEPPPELEAEPPQLSLAQLDIALNPGTGGSLAGDFAMPAIATTASSLGTADFVDFSDLDQTPRPMPGSTLDFPRRLKRKAVNGRVILLIKLDEEGRVIEARVESSDLPEFEEIVASQVEKWSFSPPTQNGKPVRAQARLPIPIKIGG